MFLQTLKMISRILVIFRSQDTRILSSSAKLLARKGRFSLDLSARDTGNGYEELLAYDLKPQKARPSFSPYQTSLAFPKLV